MRVFKLEVPSLCLGNALGFCGSGAIPLWVAAIMQSRSLSITELGWLATGELFSMAISVLAVSAWGKYSTPRRIACVAASGVLASNLVAMLPAAPALIIGRLLSGFATGALLATVTGVAARRADAQRVLALMQAVAVLLVSAIYLSSPALIGRFGAAGLFAIFAGLGAVMSVAAIKGLPIVAAPPGPVKRFADTRTFAPVLGCLALALVFMGQNTVWTYIISIGNRLGFDVRTMGTVLAIAPPLALLGPLAAHRLAERAGLLWPLLLGLCLLAIDIFFLPGAASLILFGVLTAGLNVTVMFCLPYAIALLGRLEQSGRFASAAPAFMMLGGAVAPALGSTLIAAAHFQALAVLASACVGASAVLFAIAAGLGPRGCSISNSL